MSKGARQPVPFADLNIGHWYQSRFEFKVDREISDMSRPPAVEQPPSANRDAPRNKSHRVMVLNKLPTPDGQMEGRAVCLFLTSFGGRLDLSTTITSTYDQLKYIPVNATGAMPISPYRSIPISVQALYGFVSFTSGYVLPIGGGGDEPIVRVREAARGNADTSSPDWAVEYIRRLTIAWVSWMVCDAANEAIWIEMAEGVTAEFGRPEVAEEVSFVPVVPVVPSGGSSVGGRKRLRDDEEQEEDGKDEKEKEEGKEKAQQTKTKTKTKRQRGHSEPLCLDGANDSDEDDASEFDEFDDSGIHDMETDSAATFPVLLSHDLYHLGSDDDIDEDVDFGLLDALFRPVRR